jgi:hypothetical protein
MSRVQGVLSILSYSTGAYVPSRQTSLRGTEWKERKERKGRKGRKGRTETLSSVVEMVR